MTEMLYGRPHVDFLFRRFVNEERILQKGIGVEFAYWTPVPKPPPGKKECERRLEQIRLGQLKGNESFIPTATRFAAAGLHYGG